MKYLMMMGLLLATLAAAAAERPLPVLTLADQSGAPAPGWMAEQGGPWLLLVVDAGKVASQAALARLQPRNAGQGLTVVAVGSDAAFRTLLQRHAALKDARWYRDTSDTLLKTLQLPGLPALLGMTADQQIAWQVIGLPADTAKARSLADSWLNRSMVAP
jgi:hypothetical protein